MRQRSAIGFRARCVVALGTFSALAGLSGCASGPTCGGQSFCESNCRGAVSNGSPSFASNGWRPARAAESAGAVVRFDQPRAGTPRVQTLSPPNAVIDEPLDTGDLLTVQIDGVAQSPAAPSPVRPANSERRPPSAPPSSPPGFPVLVRADGTISLPLADPVSVRGLTLSNAERRATAALAAANPAFDPQRDHVRLTRKTGRPIQVLIVPALSASGNPNEIASIGGHGSSSAPTTTTDGHSIHNRSELAPLDARRLRLPPGARFVTLTAGQNDVGRALAAAGELQGLDTAIAIHVFYAGQSVGQSPRADQDAAPANDSPTPPRPIAEGPHLQPAGFDRATTRLAPSGTSASGASTYGTSAAATSNAVRLLDIEFGAESRAAAPTSEPASTPAPAWPTHALPVESIFMGIAAPSYRAASGPSRLGMDTGSYRSQPSSSVVFLDPARPTTAASPWVANSTTTHHAARATATPTFGLPSPSPGGIDADLPTAGSSTVARSSPAMTGVANSPGPTARRTGHMKIELRPALGDHGWSDRAGGDHSNGPSARAWRELPLSDGDIVWIERATYARPQPFRSPPRAQHSLSRSESDLGVR